MKATPELFDYAKQKQGPGQCQACGRHQHTLWSYCQLTTDIHDLADPEAFAGPRFCHMRCYRQHQKGRAL